MSGLSPDQIRYIADSLISSQHELTNYLTANRKQLSKENKKIIDETADKLADQANSLVAQAIKGTAQEISSSVQGIKDATSNANMALDTLRDIKSALNIVTKLLGLATAIATGNPVSIMAAANEVIKEVNLNSVKM